MSEHYYLDVSLELLDPVSVGPVGGLFFKTHILNSLKALFGEVGASLPIDVLRYDEHKRRGILRCPASTYVKLRSSLTLSGSILGTPSAFKVHTASPSLLSLLGNSRTYEHQGRNCD